MLLSFATKASSRSERSRQWSSFTGANRVEINDDREGSLRGKDFGAVRLCHVSLGRHLVEQEMLPPGPGRDPTLKFFFQEEGTCRISQSGRVTQIHAGEWCAMRKDIPYALHSDDYSRQLAVTLPCAALPAPRPGFGWWGTPRSFLVGPAQILHASASASILAGAGLSQSDGAQIGTHFTQLLEMILRAGDPRVLPDPRVKRRQCVLNHIERNLTDPELSVATIARALGCSSRTLHKLFEGEQHTVARVIWERRLERSRSQLMDPAMAARSITEIAHYWGFSDSQHFSRAFKSRFGNTPRDCRNMSLLH